MAHKTMNYGTLPTRNEFDAAFEREASKDAGSMRVGHYGDVFAFANDPRVGTCELTVGELWQELAKAHGEWAELPCDCGKGDGNHDGNEGCTPQDAGQWCSDVLGVLGFEWV